MLRGAQKGLFDLLFRVPAECADLVISGNADIGIIPCFELIGRDLGVVPGIGIACRGPVRSILLVSRAPAAGIRTLAVDSASRTSVALARIVLARRYGVEPAIVKRPADLPRMLSEADGALIIGDPALRIDPESLAYHVYDLGREWMELTGLPMVFAVWAGSRRAITPEIAAAFRASCAFGLQRLEEIAVEEAAARAFPHGLVHRYLRSNVVFELGEAELRGMDLFLRYATELSETPIGASPVAQ